MADSLDCIQNSSPALGIDMTTMARKVHAKTSPAWGVVPTALSTDGGATVATPSMNSGTGSNTSIAPFGTEDL